MTTIESQRIRMVIPEKGEHERPNDLTKLFGSRQFQHRLGIMETNVMLGPTPSIMSVFREKGEAYKMLPINFAAKGVHDLSDYETAGSFMVVVARRSGLQGPFALTPEDKRYLGESSFLTIAEVDAQGGYSVRVHKSIRHQDGNLQIVHATLDYERGDHAFTPERQKILQSLGNSILKH